MSIAVNGSSKGSSSSYSVTTTSTTSSSSRSYNVQKVTTLREVTSKVVASCRRDLGSQSAEILQSTSEVGVLLDFIAAERLRCMPHSGSRYDKVLRWAEYFAMHVSAFSQNVSEVVMYSHEAAKYIWGSCLLLLQLGEAHIELLDKLFGVYYKLGLSLELFTKHSDLLLQSTSAQKSSGKIYASLLRVVTNSSFHYLQKASSGAIRLKAGQFESMFGQQVDAFHVARSVASTGMWSASIEESGASKSLYEVETIRRFLATQDTVVQALLSGRVSSRHSRAEYTCEWAAKRVNDFARGKDGLLLVTGKEYSGKSVLAGWIADRIRNTKGRLAHEVISFDIDPALKDCTSPLAVIQGLVLQVFDKSVGDLSLYKALCTSYRASLDGKDSAAVAESLWSALDTALNSIDKLMIVVDGIDIFEEKDRHEFLERLNALHTKHSMVKSVVLSRPLTKAPPKGAKVWTPEPEFTKKDIEHFTRERLTTSQSLASLSEEQVDTIAERISITANGSFAWADVAIEVIKSEKTLTGVTKVVDVLPKSLKDLIGRLIGTIDLKNKDTRAILAWMLVCQRPLLLTEIKQLLEIDYTNVSFSERFTDIEDDVLRACGGLVTVTDGVVRFRTLAIRFHLLDLAGNVKDFSNSSANAFPFHIQEASYDLCLRTLAYAKLVIERQYSVTTTFLTPTQLNEIFSEHPFLEYSTRYWLTHFQASPMHQYPNPHKLTSTFKTVFPSSITHSLLEGTCVRAQYSLRQAFDLLQLSLTLRKTVHGDSNESYLQTLINVAIVRRHLPIKETNEFYFYAFKLSKTLIGYESDVTATCAQYYIDSITTFTQSSTIEEVLNYIVEVQRKTYGVTHNTTITYMKRLAQYYVTVKQTTKAASLYKEVYEVLVSRSGYHSTETEEIFSQLKTVVSKEELQTITRRQQKSFESNNVTVSDEKREETTKDVVKQYENEKNVVQAEETMVNYWREISEKSRTTKDVKVQQQQVNATFEYAEFLKRNNRTEEATTILNGLYIELEKNTSVSESKVGWIQQIADTMKTYGATSYARNMYSSLWSYYRSSGKQSTKEAQTVARSLTETANLSVNETTSVESHEEILKQILETTSSTSTTVDSTTVKTSQQLISLYSKQEKHEEIIEVCRDVLQRLWPSVLTGQKDVKMTSEFTSESVSLATQLAQSYQSLHYVDEASQIYVSIFQGYRSQSKKYTKELQESATHLISHYQSIYRHTEALKIYDAYISALIEIYSETHQKVIATRYEKAELEIRQNRRKEAQASYEAIYTSLTGSSQVCHREAIDAALKLSQIYEKDKKWEQARSYYKVLWETFLAKGQEYDLGVDFVNKIFDRYMYIIENKSRSDSATIRSLVSQWRETCIKFYGAESERTLNASMRLAELEEKEGGNKDKAIEIYEFILNTHQSSKKISAASTFTVVANARQRLAHLYSSRGVTSDRAQTLYSEEFESTKSKFGLAHTNTLYWLDLLITCYIKRNNAESTKTASTKLQEVSVDIMFNETDSQKLYESSTTIAKMYKQHNISNPSGSELVSQFRRHAVSGQSTLEILKGRTITRRSYTFIVGLEEGINGGQFTTIMSELMSESLLTEAFLKAKKTSANFDVIFTYGIRLRQFLVARNRKDSSYIEEDLLEIFTKRVIGERDVEKAAIRQFFEIVLSEFGKDAQDVQVLKIAHEAIIRSSNENQFNRSYSLAVISDAYMHHYDGFRSQQKIEHAFRICLLLSGRGTRKCTDATLQKKMLHLSQVLLKEVLDAARAIQLNLIALPIQDINSLVGLLGEQKNYGDLEWILHDLWSTRHNQTSWPATTVVAIGRRLVECRFVAGDRVSALALLEDMCYNLRRVWGPLDKTTLEMENLRAEMYNATGQYTKAMTVHEDILAQLTSDELDMDQVTAGEEANIAVKHLSALRIAYFRNGAKWPADKDEGDYDSLYHYVAEQVGGEEHWKKNKVDDVNKWSSAAKSFKDDGTGKWTGVGVSWEFISDSKVKHINALRYRNARVSGDWARAVNGSSTSTTTNGMMNGSTSIKTTQTSSSSSTSNKVEAGKA